MRLSIPKHQDPTLQEQVAELMQARDQYKAAFEGANDGMVLINDDAYIVDTNPAATDIYGLEQEALLGRSITEFLPAEFDFESAWESFQTDGRQRGTVTVLGADGVERPVEYTAATDVVQGQHHIIVRDIFERIERERELDVIRRRLKVALNGTNTGVWEWNLSTDDVVWTESMERLFGLDPGSFEGTFEAFARYVHPDDLPRVREAIDTAVENSDAFVSEYRITRADGTERWVHAHGDIREGDDGTRRMIGIATDITDSRQREELLRETTERLESIIECSPAAIVEIDTQGVVRRWNPTAESVLTRWKRCYSMRV